MKQILALSALFLSLALSADRQDKPNIVLLFADDGGYADWGFHGSEEIKTPNLDKLADNGIRFTQGYVSDATCGPTRAGLVTGRYQQKFGFEEVNVPGFMSPNSALDGPNMGVPLSEKMVGEYLQEQGYKTAVYGKWHLGGTEEYHPVNRGFDEFYGFRGGMRDYWAYEGEPRDPLNKLERNFEQFEEPEGYLTDELANAAVDFIERNQENPFFIFLSFNAVHTPMQARQEDMDQFPELEGKRKELAGMTLALDRACGKVIDKIAELGLGNNTLIIFTNDNGGPSDKNASINAPLSGTKSNHLEGGIRVPFLMSWPGVLDAGVTYDYPVSTLDLTPTFYDLAGGDSSSVEKFDGVNLMPFITGKNSERPHQQLFWKKGVRAVIRDGDWKLIRHIDRPAELYYLPDDIAEHNDLAAQEPGRLRRMFKELFAWELTLERPRWLLKNEYEKYDVDRMDQYR